MDPLAPLRPQPLPRSQRYRVHLTDETVLVRCYRRNVPFPQLDPIVAFPIDGVLYLSGPHLYFGASKRWYRIDIGELSSITTEIQNYKLLLSIDHYIIAFYYHNRFILGLFRDLLQLYRSFLSIFANR